MKKNSTSKRRKIAALMLASAIGYSAFVGGLAGTTKHFTDVPSNHWASSFINEMAEGGLIAGYGGGIFGPEDNFNIDQMATIICSAKGAPQKNQNGYWAYGAVDYCVNTLKCLPSKGAITAANYGVPCTRELAYYMLMTGLGVGPESTATANNKLEPDDIPDYSRITVAYQQAVMKAYKTGLTFGTDDKMTFQPKALLNRAQAATMFVRAGWTKASAVATPVAEGKTVDEIYAALKASGKWTEENNGMFNVLRYKDRYAGNITVSVRDVLAGRVMTVTLYEATLEGKGLTDYSAYKFAGRQVAKSILDIAYPTQSYDAYMGMKSVLLQESYEYGGSQYPSVLRWYDGRTYICRTSGGSHCMLITIGELNDEAAYNTRKAEIRHNSKLVYGSYAGGPNHDVKAFELDKW